MRPLFAAAIAALMACNPPPSQADLDGTRGGQVEVFFNDPGSRLQNIWTPDVVDLMVDMIDGATATLDFAVMGFSKTEVVDAMVRAHDRGIKVRMVGDAGHLYNSGYEAMYDRHIPTVTGNDAHIMHDKFMIVDGRFVMGGTSNWTPTDLVHNSNNFFVIDSPAVAADFLAEFEQMFAGAFGHSKIENVNGRVYQLGDTTIEVWFSPNEDSLGRILELVDGAQESVRFTIFAFTKDQVGSAFIRAQERFAEADLAEGVDLEADFRDRRSVAGLIDQSQLHSNGQYHEVYRLLGAQVPMRMDGNDSSRQPGDYQAGGGRLHSKTMVIDADGENPVVISGSFNWSSSATQSNDEFMVVMHGPRIAEEYDKYFEQLWANGRRMGETFVGEDVVAGDVQVNEVQWYGVHANDLDGFDEFVELRNNTDRELVLDLWQIANPDDFVLGFPPGTVIPAGGHYLVVDHVLEPYQDGAPQDSGSAYLTGDMVVNAFNDNRQSRLYLKDTALELMLLDPAGEVVDRVGDGGPAFAGGPEGITGVVRSMERVAIAGDGTQPEHWQSCTNDEGGALVSPEPLDTSVPDVTYKGLIRATPGEPNSQ
jgi:phosphatidylserine/phosphatidylglycerophosphate/cardiolipin synthase-like enzyme